MGTLPPFLCEIVHTSTWKCFVFLLGKFFIASGKYFPLFWWNFSISTGKSFLFLMRNGIHSHWETFLIFTWKYFTSTLKRHSVLWLLFCQFLQFKSKRVNPSKKKLFPKRSKEGNFSWIIIHESWIYIPWLHGCSAPSLSQQVVDNRKQIYQPSYNKTQHGSKVIGLGHH